MAACGMGCGGDAAAPWTGHDRGHRVSQDAPRRERNDMKKKPQPYDIRKYSSLVVDGLKQTAARAMLRAVGFSDADFAKPQIGVASTWSDLTPCNMHIDE